MGQQFAQIWLNFWNSNPQYNGTAIRTSTAKFLDGKITFWLYDLGQQGCISIIYFLG